MENKKQSSIEWLVKQFNEKTSRIANIIGVEKYNSIIEQAKAIHKEEMFEYIKQKYCIGQMSMEFHRLEFEQYYNETFGGNNE